MNKNKYKLNKAIAEKITFSFQYLIGQTFNLKYQQNCKIDRIDVIDVGNGEWEVVLVYDIFKKPCIPEFYGFRCPTINIFEYLSNTNIEFDPKLFDL